MPNFADDTALSRTTDGGYTCVAPHHWELFGVNGGFLAAVALRAAGEISSHARPASLAASFMARSKASEPIAVFPQVLKSSSKADLIEVTLAQGERTISKVHIWTAAEGTGLEHQRRRELPAPETLPTLRERANKKGPWGLSIRNNFIERPLDWLEEWEARGHSDPSLRTWVRLDGPGSFDDAFLDAGRVAVVADFFPPMAAYRAHPSEDRPLVATSALMIAFHSQGSISEELFVDSVSPAATAGLMGGAVEVFDVDGLPVANATQQNLVRSFD